MPLKYLVTRSIGTIAAGGTGEDTWTPDEDVHIKRIYIVERSDQSLSNVDAYVKIGEDVLTKPSAPASLFGQDKVYAIDVDRDVPKGMTVYVKLQNNLSSSINVVVVYEVTG